jgi:hypothetical protein
MVIQMVIQRSLVFLFVVGSTLLVVGSTLLVVGFTLHVVAPRYRQIWAARQCQWRDTQQRRRDSVVRKLFRVWTFLTSYTLSSRASAASPMQGFYSVLQLSITYFLSQLTLDNSQNNYQNLINKFLDRFRCMLVSDESKESNYYSL